MTNFRTCCVPVFLSALCVCWAVCGRYGALHAEDEPAKLAWRLAYDACLEYRVSEIKADGSTRELKDKFFLILGHEVGPGGEPNRVFRALDEAPVAPLFALPDEEAARAGKWTKEHILPDLDDVPVLTLSGGYRLAGSQKIGKDDCTVIIGEFAARPSTKEEVKKTNTGLVAIKGGVLVTKLFFCVKKGWMVRGAFSFDLQLSKAADEKSAAKDEEYSARLQYDLCEVACGESKAFHSRVDDAIEQGVKYLRSVHQGYNWAGGYQSAEETTPLVIYALLKSKVSPQDKLIVHSFEWMAKNRPIRNYGHAMSMMAMQARLEAEGREPNDKERALLMESFIWLRDNGQNSTDGVPLGLWGYPDQPDGKSKSFDNSNTQFAILGFRAAARVGMEIPASVWFSCIDSFLKNQEPTGPEIAVAGSGTSAARKARGWAYHGAGAGGAYGSMTCAGVSSIAIAEESLFRLKAEIPEKLADNMNVSMKDGLAWLENNYSVRFNPKSGERLRFYYYYLYSVERTGALAAVRRIGRCNWYFDGAMMLFNLQQPDGSWTNPGCGVEAGTVIATPLALLFLNRATIPVRTSAGDRRK
ncbi:MAG: hypothetical protein RDV41_01635 [Planctomycetota bacterium]|nr:hypothetical protein [Planctomycetota bacterium]